MKKIILALILMTAVMPFITQRSHACSRAVYLGPDSMVITGRTMDWPARAYSNLWIFPRGMERQGGLSDNSVKWKSKYGSIIVSFYDLGGCDGMNEKGLVANALFLNESKYSRGENDNRPILGIALWCQYLLDNFSTVEEAVKVLKADEFQIATGKLPSGKEILAHVAISDPTGNSAILEYIDGHLQIHEGCQYQVMTNSPIYSEQLANYETNWKDKNGTKELPGTNQSKDRFARASFYINAVKKTSDPEEAVAAVFSVMRNVSVPFGISTANKPNLSFTRWRTVFNQKDMVMYFESTKSPYIIWIPFKDVDFSENADVKVLPRAKNEVCYTGNCLKDFVKAEPFKPLLVK